MRDDEYMRDLLFKIERAEDPIIAVVHNPHNPDPETEKRNYHIKLLYDRGLLALKSGSSYRLTDEGHNFIESIRDDTCWNRIKSVGAGSLASMIAAAGDLALEKAVEKAVEIAVNVTTPSL